MAKFSRAVSVVSLAFLMLVALPAPASAAAKKNLTKVFFLNMGVQANARGKVMVVENKAQTMLKIHVSHAVPGVYDVVLDGAVVDTLTVGSNGKGTLRYRRRNHGRRAGSPLPFDPRGGQIEIASTGTGVLEADVPDSPNAGSDITQIAAELTNLGVVPGEAEAVFQERCGRMKFRVELKDVDEGVYDLLVDGTKVADIQVDATGFGEVDFDSRPSIDDDGDDGGAGDGPDGQSGDDGGGDHTESAGVDGHMELLLTFDPRGKTITVGQGGVDLFSADFPTEPPV